jgi:hypothetical protein
MGTVTAIPMPHAGERKGVLVLAATSAPSPVEKPPKGPHLRQACVPSMRSVASRNARSIRAGDTKRREEDGAMPDTASPSPLPPLLQSFDDPLGRKIIELHVWAVREGLCGTAAAALFEGLCRRLVSAGLPVTGGRIGCGCHGWPAALGRVVGLLNEHRVSIPIGATVL